MNDHPNMTPDTIRNLSPRDLFRIAKEKAEQLEKRIQQGRLQLQEMEREHGEYMSVIMALDPNESDIPMIPEHDPNDWREQGF